MWIADNWESYELIDCSDGQRLEAWGGGGEKYLLIRPDPQVIWKNRRVSPLWSKADAVYTRSKSGGGFWSEGGSGRKLPEEWKIAYRELNFIVRPTGFKHTGVFPEQAVNWDWFSGLIEGAGRPVRVLNLFAYTGGATIAAAKAGAQTTHVDAAKGMVAQAKNNAAISGLADAKIRYIVDDCRKFVEREIRRGSFYDGIIMDPPSYGRGPSGEIWKLEDNLGEFVELALSAMSDKPLFLLVNSYTTGLSASTVGYVTRLALRDRFGEIPEISADEIGLPVTEGGGVLPCGSSVRVEWK